MWTLVRYLPTSLFSLRPAFATSSGAQSLLIPTPYAVKMALVSAAIRLFGFEPGVAWWPVIRDLDVAIAPPDVIVVNKTFIKIQRKTDPPKQKGVDKASFVAEKIVDGKWPFSPTIAFREFVQFGGEVGLAVQSSDQTNLPLDQLLMQINYLGKRGGFWQPQAAPEIADSLTDQWTLLTVAQSSFSFVGTLQILDDCGSKLTWDHIDIYSSKSIKLGSDERVLRHIVLPYQARRSSYRYTMYERIA